MYVYNRDDTSSSNLYCSGDHELKCAVSFTTGYYDDGVYRCKGHNKVRNNRQEDSEKSSDVIVCKYAVVTKTIVRTEFISNFQD